MIKWLKRLFHFHEWEIIAQSEYEVPIWGKSRGNMIRYACKCKICGELKTEEVYC